MSACLDSGLWVRVNLSRTAGVAVVNPPTGSFVCLTLTSYIYSRQPGQEVVCLLSLMDIFKNRVAFNLGDHLAGAPNRFPGNGDGNT
jgi:hypothetical protein